MGSIVCIRKLLQEYESFHALSTCISIVIKNGLKLYVAVYIYKTQSLQKSRAGKRSGKSPCGTYVTCCGMCARNFSRSTHPICPSDLCSVRLGMTAHFQSSKRSPCPDALHTISTTFHPINTWEQSQSITPPTSCLPVSTLS